MITLVLLSSCVVLLSLPSTDAQSTATLLSLPETQLCINRPREWVWEIKIANQAAQQHNYYHSWNQERALGQSFANGSLMREKVNWLEARNECRKRCMDSIGIETEQENDLVLDFFRKNNKDATKDKIQYIWTSGRLCDFKGCNEREDLKPLSVNGWFWSNTNTKMAPTNKSPPGWKYQPWSQTGHTKVPQPDNAEFDINQTHESCLGVLDNIYTDGIVWHDIACYHKKSYICEDSDLLINYIASEILREKEIATSKRDFARARELQNDVTMLRRTTPL